MSGSTARCRPWRPPPRVLQLRHEQHPVVIIEHPVKHQDPAIEQFPADIGAETRHLLCVRHVIQRARTKAPCSGLLLSAEPLREEPTATSSTEPSARKPVDVRLLQPPILSPCWFSALPRCACAAADGGEQHPCLTLPPRGLRRAVTLSRPAPNRLRSKTSAYLRARPT